MSSSSSSIASNGSTTRLPQSLLRQQDCYLHIRYGATSGYGYAIKQSQAPECVVSSPGDNISCPPGWSSTECLSRFLSIFSSSRFLIPGRGELPTGIVVADGAFSIVKVSLLLDQALIPVPKYQDAAWSSRHAQPS
ncbi:hypothetical protein EDC04DRAFT_3136179 [Pisolithus marmoratus]|nr:hypothetical protein EDC04DRAFT_3136179 [Pisolithus marmoratus]